MARRFEKSMTRSGALMIFEVWSRAAELCYPEFGVPSALLPAEILVNEHGEVTEYIDPNAIGMLPKAMNIVLDADPEYFHRVFDEYSEVLDALIPIWDRNTALSRSSLVNFLDLISRGWRGLEWAYFVPTIESLPVRVRDRALKLRHKGERFMDASDEVIRKSLAEIYPNVLYIYLLSRKEFDADCIPHPHILQGRSERYALIGGTFVSEVELKRLEILYQDAEARALNEILGRPGFPGIVRGTVRVVTRPEQFDSFQDSEILVTFMTTPNYLPLLKKAAGFITDEGGITCHAAIIARELGKPCIIGTKIATKVLKDGDMVEVDAEKGIVKIISRA